MSKPALAPTAPTTLVIMLGASVWPNSPSLPPSKAFIHAAQGFKNYMCDPHGFGLPSENLLDLFDAETNASDQLETLGFFLEQKMQTLEAANQAVRDVLVYFVGHGAFAGPSADFYLMHRRTKESSLRASGIAIDALAEVLREHVRQTRRYLFLDCCFAAAAFRAFQGGPDQVAIKKTQDAFSVRSRASGFPEQGMVLLCSSDHQTPSQLLPDQSCTMFSHALLTVLRNGDLSRSHPMSLRDIKELVEEQLVASPEKNAPRPSLLSPDQSKGDVADIRFFPNPRAGKGTGTLGVPTFPPQKIPATSDAFISYSRREQGFARQLVEAFAQRGYNAWFDRNDVRPAGEFWEDIKAGIEEASAFIFIMSPDSITSEPCLNELKYALHCGKKLIPLHYRPVDRQRVPEQMNKLDWIEGASFDEMFEKTLRAILTDKEDWKQAGRWLRSGSEWQKNHKQNSGLLLHGKDLKKAEEWLKKAEHEPDKKPHPLPLHVQFIRESRHVAKRTFLARITILVLFMALMAVAGGVFVLFVR